MSPHVLLPRVANLAKDWPVKITKQSKKETPITTWLAYVPPRRPKRKELLARYRLD